MFAVGITKKFLLGSLKKQITIGRRMLVLLLSKQFNQDWMILTSNSDEHFNSNSTETNHECNLLSVIERRRQWSRELWEVISICRFVEVCVLIINYCKVDESSRSEEGDVAKKYYRKWTQTFLQTQLVTYIPLEGFFDNYLYKHADGKFHKTNLYNFSHVFH